MENKINKYSRYITQNNELPAAHAMLYATGMKDDDFNKAQIAVVSNWYEGNPCNIHLNDLSDHVKLSIINNNLIGIRINTIGISDGITMGTSGMRYSLPSREIIADSIESVVNSHYYDGVIGIPGCDKNIPGLLMAILRINRPSIIIYGGSIASGNYKNKKIDIVSAFEALGRKKSNKIDYKEYRDIIKQSCPGPGACGGMYTANTMAVILETMGITLPFSSSYPAISKNKIEECNNIGCYIKMLLKYNIRPKDIINKKSIENGIRLAICLGGSTNLVLHMLSIAKHANINLSLNDIQDISDNTPFIGNLKPSGKFLMEDIHTTIGGLPVIIKYLLKKGMLFGDCLTVTGKTLYDNVKDIPDIHFNQKIIYSIENPIKKHGNIQVLYGNLASQGAIAKITGKEGVFFRGKAKVFNSEEETNKYILNNKIPYGTVIVIRYVGPKGGPGMPEMLKPTSYIMGKGLGTKIALITDGRFSGGSHGFVVGHVTPEAYEGGLIAFINDEDIISIDANKNQITLEISDTEIENRKKNWEKPNFRIKTGYLHKYSKLVSSASTGCVTD